MHLTVIAKPRKGLWQSVSPAKGTDSHAGLDAGSE